MQTVEIKIKCTNCGVECKKEGHYMQRGATKPIYTSHSCKNRQCMNYTKVFTIDHRVGRSFVGRPYPC